MTLGPEEVEAHTFRQRLRGYDPVEVDALLARVAGVLRELRDRRDALAAERDRAEERADRAEERAARAEDLVRTALERLGGAEEVPRARAEEDAATIRQQAEAQAAEAHRAARDEIARRVAAVQGAAAAHRALRAALEDLAQRSAILADAQRDAVDPDVVQQRLVELVASTERARQDVEPAGPEEPAGRDAAQRRDGDAAGGRDGAVAHRRLAEPPGFPAPPHREGREHPGDRWADERAAAPVEQLPVPPMMVGRRRR